MFYRKPFAASGSLVSLTFWLHDSSYFPNSFACLSESLEWSSLIWERSFFAWCAVSPFKCLLLMVSSVSSVVIFSTASFRAWVFSECLCLPNEESLSDSAEESSTFSASSDSWICSFLIWVPALRFWLWPFADSASLLLTESENSSPDLVIFVFCFFVLRTASRRVLTLFSL